ncbi:SDR family oxidoreductase [Parvibaculum sp.]|uniref:SDR family oxidoreductase n=1 Tax=Parvibaculum sp. TaxID=2024848 RepID=UPI002B531ABE|nr:SDR family oxidoreductase [Parvibaculum sp.]HUD50710.1 SDR family oxidoreductase [Parvibaculum sp.]
MGRVDNKVVVVTGGGSGCGREDSILLAKEGAKVIVTDIDIDAAKAVAAEIGDGKAIALQHNIANEDDWVRVMKAGRDAFGPINGVVNNAGILLMGDFESLPFADWQKTQEVNVTGYYLGCKHAIIAMKEHGGAIVNMASIVSTLGSANYFAYAASKAAVASLTGSVVAYCKQAGYKIRCNAIQPDGILTPMVLKQMNLPLDTDLKMIKDSPMGYRFCYPHEVANLVLFLISDESASISNARVSIDNGNYGLSEF